MEILIFFSRIFTTAQAKQPKFCVGPDSGRILSWGGSIVEWLACWTQAQKGLGLNRSRDAVG